MALFILRFQIESKSMKSLLEVFLEQELDDSVSKVLEAAVDEFRASGAKVALRSFEFNCFNVILDFENNIVLLEDALACGPESEQKIRLSVFLKVCGLSWQ